MSILDQIEMFILSQRTNAKRNDCLMRLERDLSFVKNAKEVLSRKDETEMQKLFHDLTTLSKRDFGYYSSDCDSKELDRLQCELYEIVQNLYVNMRMEKKTDRG